MNLLMNSLNEMITFDKGCLLLLVVYRLISVYFVQTSFVPDEYWQSLEVAHKLKFNYGYLTWEWQKAIRSCVYPKLIENIFSLCPGTVFFLTVMPRVFQALLSSIGDYYTVKLSIKVFGNQAGKWTLFSILTSWFLYYCSSRTLTNMTETSFSACGLYFYPWKQRKSHRLEWMYLWFAAWSLLIRPTAVIFWLPLGIAHLWKEKDNLIPFLSRVIFVGIITLGILLLVDYSCYGYWVLTPYRFFVFNWSNDIGAFYGSHPWHWYFTSGLWVVMAVHSLPLLLGLQLRKAAPMFYFVLFYIIVLSQLSHKEFRFLLPIIPFCICICGAVLSEISSNRMLLFKWKLNPKLGILIAFSMVAVNVPLGLYMGLVHQRGTLDAVRYLSKFVTDQSSVLFLMPCHSTPFYSHIHKNITMKFLTCEPNFYNVENYEDEADVFYKDPQTWLNSYLNNTSSITTPASYSDTDNRSQQRGIQPSHIVMFSNLKETVSDILRTYKYDLCYFAWYTHFAEKRTGKYVDVYCKDSVLDGAYDLYDIVDSGPYE